MDDELDAAERRLLRVVTSAEPRSVERPEQGRDNRVAVVDGRWVLRVPATDDARSYVRNERAVLDALPADVRVPRPLGFVEDGMVYELLPGEALDRRRWEGLDDDLRERVARDLRATLDAIHDLDQAVLTGVDVLDQTWVRRSLASCLHVTPRAPLDFDPADLLPRFEAAWELESARTTIVHVDLKSAHVLVDDAGQVAVIDFGGVGIGDPALDYGVLAHWIGIDVLEAMGLGGMALEARARCWADLYHLRRCTRGWTRTAPWVTKLDSGRGAAVRRPSR